MTFQHTNPFIPGDTIRAEPVNAAFNAIAVNLQEIDQARASKIFTFPDSFTGVSKLATVGPNSFIWVNATGNLDVYPKVTFDSEVQSALDAASSASGSASQAATSEYNAKQSEIAAAASAELAQGAAVSVAGAAFFAGLWNASTGVFPAAPPDGSSMWEASTNGVSATAAVKQGDLIIWDIIAGTYRHFAGQERVAALEAQVTALGSGLDAQFNYIEAIALAGNKQ